MNTVITVSMRYSKRWAKCLVVGVAILALSVTLAKAASQAVPCFRIQVVDDQTGRGVPLVILKTVNRLSYVTDSNGIVAFNEPGLMDQTVFFHISSHGYEYPADGFGYRGKAIDIKPGGRAVIKIKRLNIAERLYRITGQGIYRDSLLTGDAVSLANPVLNGQVFGQDSVCVCRYNDKLYWFWGDTERPSYPLGHFSTAGATSLLPAQGSLDPSAGVDLTYFVDEKGFSRKMAPLPESGLVWIQALMTARNTAGKIRLLTQYARLKNMSEILERGLMVFNDDRQQFEPILRGDPEVFLFNDLGHPLSVRSGPNDYYYFATPFPLGVRMRAKTDWNTITDPNQYEVFTALYQTSLISSFRWVASNRLLDAAGGNRAKLKKELTKEKQTSCSLTDIETGKTIIPHGGSVYWNEYRKKWIMIAVQQGGTTSYLGEVWYAEADTPVGPWRYARKVVTHNAYSFYNPKHHPYFDQEGGRHIYFEGTYSHTFSGTEEKATPRYDYNQIMYRLDLADACLFLPEPVYRIRAGQGRRYYHLGSAVDRIKDISNIEAVAFYAKAPDRTSEGQIAVYENTDSRGRIVLTTDRPDSTSVPVFFGLSVDAQAHPAAVELFAYRHRKTNQVCYSVQALDTADWEKSPKPLCRVWKDDSSLSAATVSLWDQASNTWQGPPEIILADWQAHP